jgi:preprotein translocase SecE subunit
MARKKTEDGDEKGFFGSIHGTVKDTVSTYRGEFKKIVWPSKYELFRKTVTVMIISLIFGAYIALADLALGNVFSTLVGWL